MDPRDIVENSKDSFIVHAGPGSGKTQLIAEKVRVELSRAAKNRRVVALSFSKKAAEEMLSRINGARNAALMVRTYHSLAFWILRQHFGVKDKIIDEEQQRKLVEEVIKEQRVSLRVDEALAFISYIKRKDIPAEKLGKRSDVARVYRAYQERLHRDALIDFDDLLRQAVGCLEKEKVLAEYLRDHTAFLAVDEFQDTSALQYRLLQLVLPERFIVTGDEDQAIYGWRGASPEFFRKLRRERPDARVAILEKNYRNPREIVKVAERLLRAIKNRFEKPVIPVRENGYPSVFFLPASTLLQEAEAIAEAVKNYPLLKFAVLARTREKRLDLHSLLEKIRVRYNPFPAVKSEQELERLRRQLPLFAAAKKPAAALARFLTIHAAKGLEFDVVIISRLQQGYFPAVREDPLRSEEEIMDEEIRLLYTALTRAKKIARLLYDPDEPSSLLQILK